MLNQLYKSGEAQKETLRALTGAIAQQLNALADEARLLIH